MLGIRHSFREKWGSGESVRRGPNFMIMLVSNFQILQELHNFFLSQLRSMNVIRMHILYDT